MSSGRPSKNNAPYFGHDNDMRNHRKIKAIRAKYSMVGYGVWCMFLEVLTHCDYNRWEMSDLEIELLSGDFGVSVTEIRDILDYCIKLELLVNDGGFLYSNGLNDRLRKFYEKRELAKQRASDQSRQAGKFSKATDDADISVTEKPTSKSKGKVKDKVKDIDKEKESRKKKTFSPPSLPDVENYVKDRFGLSDLAASKFADRFVSYYSEQNWMVGKGSRRQKMKNWSVSVSTQWKETVLEFSDKYPVSPPAYVPKFVP